MKFLFLPAVSLTISVGAAGAVICSPGARGVTRGNAAGASEDVVLGEFP